MITTHFRKASGALIVYDITNRQSFESVKYWITQFRENAGMQVNLILVGNKLDLVESGEGTRQVDFFEARELCQQVVGDENSCIETSALEGENVVDAFSMLLEDIYNRKNETDHSQIIKGDQLTIYKQAEPKSDGCCC